MFSAFLESICPMPHLHHEHSEIKPEHFSSYIWAPIPSLVSYGVHSKDTPPPGTGQTTPNCLETTVTFLSSGLHPSHGSDAGSYFSST